MVGFLLTFVAFAAGVVTAGVLTVNTANELAVENFVATDQSDTPPS